jgi:hypothetical protein
MDAERLPAAILAAAADRSGGASEVAATALDGLLQVADDPELLEAAVAALLAGQPAMAPLWHLARAARGPRPATALAGLRASMAADADAAVEAAAGWLRRRLAGAGPEAVATVSHSSLVDRVLARLDPAGGERRQAPSLRPAAAHRVRQVVGLVGADAIGPEAFLNAAGTGELAARLPTLVVATAIKLLPGAAFGRLAGPGFEAVPLEAVVAVVVGPEVLSPAEAGRRAQSAG